MLHVFVDGDNIQIEAFYKFVRDELEHKFGTEYNLVFFCQSNLIFKYSPYRHDSITFKCTNTVGKNASDARIIFEAGKHLIENKNDKIVIVSNDKIFNEIVNNENIFCIGYVNSNQKLKLTKNNIRKTLSYLIANKNSSDDIYVEDFKENFKKTNTSILKQFIICNTPDVKISCNDALYFNNVLS